MTEYLIAHIGHTQKHGDLISTSGKPLFIDSVYLDCDEQDVDGDDYFVCSAGSDEYGQFIAAASPRVVLGLLDRIASLEAVCEQAAAAKRRNGLRDALNFIRARLRA